MNAHVLQSSFDGRPCLIDGIVWVMALEFGERFKRVKNTNKCIISYPVSSVCNKHSSLSTTEIKSCAIEKITLFNLDMTNIY